MKIKLSDNLFALQALVTWGPDGLNLFSNLDMPSWLLGNFVCKARRSMCFPSLIKPPFQSRRKRCEWPFWIVLCCSFGLLRVCQSSPVKCKGVESVFQSESFWGSSLHLSILDLNVWPDQGVRNDAAHINHLIGFTGFHPSDSRRTCPRPLLPLTVRWMQRCGMECSSWYVVKHLNVGRLRSTSKDPPCLHHQNHSS